MNASGLTGPVLAAVLLGALLHASWNAFIKSGGDKALDTALISALGTVVALPLLLLVEAPTQAAWPYLALSALVHLGYYTALAGAYHRGDLSLTYPVMRGSAPLLVALASAWVIGERLSPLAWLGVALLSAGVLWLGFGRPLASLAALARQRSALRFAFANALIIALYTVIDGLGARASGSPVGYVAVLNLLNGLPYLLLVLWRRDGAARLAARHYMQRRWPLALLCAAASMASYGIALWAMTRAPVATVAALRETSVLFAALIGTLLLREAFGWPRAAATLLVLLGVMALRLG